MYASEYFAVEKHIKITMKNKKPTENKQFVKSRMFRVTDIAGALNLKQQG